MRKEDKIPMSSDAILFKKIKFYEFVFVALLLIGGILAGVMLAIQNTRYGDFPVIMTQITSIIGIVLVFVGFIGFSVCYFKLKKMLDR